MSDVVQKLWGFCHTLRHDGIDCGDYIEQITFLLFLKMADEKGVALPKGCDWPKLRDKSGSDLLDHYVDLLEKAASEGKKGAGQYFTPRVLIQSIVRSMKPDPRAHREFTICDPACGTGGFLVAAYEWLMGQTKGGALDRDVARRVRQKTYFGQDLVARPRRLALMNLFLHGLEPKIVLGDTIYEFPGPDNCLFADQAGQVFDILTQDCNLHTVLRLPRGTFTPYSQGVKANVVLFTKGCPTETVWIYDARSNVPGITKKDRPLSAEHFAEFDRCFGPDPHGRAKRKPSDSPADRGYLGGGRWRSFTIAEVRSREFKLDSFKWLKDESLEDADDLPPPDELATDAVAELEGAVEELNAVLALLENGNGTPTGRAKTKPTR